jgi:hypothetical protein
LLGVISAIERRLSPRGVGSSAKGGQPRLPSVIVAVARHARPARNALTVAAVINRPKLSGHILTIVSSKDVDPRGGRMHHATLNVTTVVIRNLAGINVWLFEYLDNTPSRWQLASMRIHG